MTDKKHKPNFSLRARAVFLSLLALYSYVIAPAMATSPPRTQSIAADSSNNPAPSATPLKAQPPMKLMPPPPAESPSSDILPLPAESPSQDVMPATNRSPVNGRVSAPDIPQLPLTPGMIDASYVLGPGDQLLVSDYSSSDTAQPINSPTVPILPDGTVAVHPVGIVKAAGLTLGQLTESVNKMAERYIIKPDLEIQVIKVRPNIVYILGEVNKPGLYTNESAPVIGSENVVASAANLTVVSALQKAGGIKPSADVRNVRITRLGAPEQLTCNLWQLLVDGDASQDFGLLSGDVIYVPKGGADYDPEALGLAASQHRRVRIWGAVKAPGLLDMDPHDDILSAISRAGGFTTTATRSWVLLSRVNRDGTVTTQKISMKKGIQDPDSVARTHLKPGDLILVHDSLLKKGGGVVFQAGVYFLFAIGIVTYSLYLGQAIQGNNTGSSTNSTTTTVPVIAPITGTSTGSP